jgi:hypothetical protein
MSKPTENKDGGPAEEGLDQKKLDKSLLGLSTSELAGLSVDELVGNKTAITMLMHYYKQLVDANSALENQINTYRSYEAGYEKKKLRSSVGAILLVLSNVLIGFGVNLITSANYWPGGVCLVPGLITASAGLWFSLAEDG